MRARNLLTLSLLLTGCVRSICADKTIDNDESGDITVEDVESLMQSLSRTAEELSCDDFCQQVSNIDFAEVTDPAIESCSLELDLSSFEEGADAPAETVIGQVGCAVSFVEEGHETYGSCNEI